MSQELFEGLLDWLDPNRHQAALKYEQIRAGLINYFTFRAPCDAEDLADETINRVSSRLDDIKAEVNGERSRYFFGVARKVQLEYLRRKTPQAPGEHTIDSERLEAEHRCLEECIGKLSAENRKLVLRYYQADGRQKIEDRKQLADELGIAPNALRIRAYRIRAALQKCLEKCVEDSLP
ncbi:MAG TPA: sigma-70 family RNA polymerase sigma factor [Pyrinomonadaceae bacterium]|nr:sigma-70 family RNA polymerase sigma factor [Pyrinomonadaceae bacterium]